MVFTFGFDGGKDGLVGFPVLKQDNVCNDYYIQRDKIGNVWHTR